MEPLKLVKYALDSAISLVKKGEAPSQALEKVAKEFDLNKDFIQRTGEALNVALTYNHFKTAADRATEFPIADITQVTKNIFGEQPIVEKSAQAKLPNFDKFNFNNLLTNPKVKAASAAIYKTNEKAAFDSFTTSFKGLYKKAVDYISRIEKELESMEVERYEKKAYLEAAFHTLQRELQKSAEAREPFHAIETNAINMFGERAAPYLDLLYKAANLKEERGTHKINKYAEAAEGNFYAVLNSLLKCASDLNVLTKDLEDARLYVAHSRNYFKEAGLKLHNAEKTSLEAECSELADKIAEAIEKEGKASENILSWLMGSYADARAGAKSPTFKNSNIDNRERSMLLQELIMTDPILAHQDPKRILQAYTQLLRLAPHLAKEKEIVRSFLRQLTATQSLAPTEANQLIEANTNYLKQHQLVKSHNAEKNK